MFVLFSSFTIFNISDFSHFCFKYFQQQFTYLLFPFFSFQYFKHFLFFPFFIYLFPAQILVSSSFNIFSISPYFSSKIFTIKTPYYLLLHVSFTFYYKSFQYFQSEVSVFHFSFFQSSWQLLLYFSLLCNDVMAVVVVVVVQ